MGDEETRTKQEPSWWPLDASPGGYDPSSPFGEPVEWPDAFAWEQLLDVDRRDRPSVPSDLDLLAIEGLPYNDGGGHALPTELEVGLLPDSIWAPGDGPSAVVGAGAPSEDEAQA
ncbi:MAG: hypothetical protein M3203_12700, partial [Actinomycetota bacterium]|nr:hypothetical protein [Actinomycetota bacterium]